MQLSMAKMYVMEIIYLPTRVLSVEMNFNYLT